MYDGTFNPKRTRALVEIGTGVALVLLGVIATVITYDAAVQSGGQTYLVVYGPIVAGVIALVRGVIDLFYVEGFGRRKRSEREVRLLQLVIGSGLTGLSVIVALTMFGTSSWGFGLTGVAGFSLTIGIVLLGLAASSLVPLVRPHVSIGLVSAGVALIAKVVRSPDLFAHASVARFLLDHAMLVVGLCLVSDGVFRWLASRPDPVLNLTAKPLLTHDQRRRRMVIELGLGGLLILIGTAITIVTYDDMAFTGRGYLVMYGPIVAGILVILRALMGDFKSFVAWRYLLVFESKVSRRTRVTAVISLVVALYAALSWNHYLGPVSMPRSPQLVFALVCFLGIVVAWGILRHSKLAFGLFCIGAGAMLAGSVVSDILRPVDPGAFRLIEEDGTAALRQILGIASLVGGVLAALALFFGTLRAFFTFFTTVPIGGVWIGTAALVCVLAVMSGFETDLREKILGSNAHIQITREDGEFVEWRAIKDRIDRIPGVVASSPYAVSEVVIAAHNNGMNVIIKGIDPDTVGKVTDLVNDLEDPEALQRLEPLVEDNSRDLSIPQTPQRADVLDPPPPDMPNGGEPIDFSSGGAPDDSDAPFGGDAPDIIGVEDKTPPRADATPRADVIDPPPSDMLEPEEPPVDFSSEDAELPITVIDIPNEPSLSRRTQSLPGVLVGRELVKQTHLYTGEEVRVVSPLSDPSNPDATGTPIPFNRDYRVAGIFFTGMYEYDLKYVYVTLDSLQDFLDRGDTIDGIEVRIQDADDTERFIPTDAGPGLLGAALGPEYRIVDWRELNRSLFSALKLEKIAMFLVLGIVILVASFSIVGNLIMVVVEKAREIALLKTLGASNFGTMQLFAIQGLMIGMIGTVLGVATGLLACWAGKRFGLPLNPDVYYIDRLPIHVDPQSVAAAAAAGVVISILATLYPALVAARVRPAAGMRH
ncbi:MAG: FtsX-like permease family protein [Deltaproteobacteria bacterium]|nr:FtsX-like permease family protein [Deltaproteobacteria bacterium]